MRWRRAIHGVRRKEYLHHNPQPLRGFAGIVLNDLEGGNIYQIGCQLHPPHRTATLVVMKSRNRANPLD